jgi:tetratricopeptide (TPR) repeat protein
LTAAGRFPEAEQVYRQALTGFEKLASRFPDKPDYRREQARIHKSIAEMPIAQAQALAGQGQWQRAAAAFDEVVEQFPEQWQSWYQAALAHLIGGDADGYRRLCAGALDRFGQTEDPASAAYLAWAGVLDGEAKVDPARVLRLAERAAAADSHSYLPLRVLGGALLRAGRPEEAVRRLNQALEVQQSSPACWLLLALAHQRLGHPEEARGWLRKARQWVGQATPKGPEQAGALPGPDTLPWTERLGLRVLLREAEARVGDAPSGPPASRDKEAKHESTDRTQGGR